MNIVVTEPEYQKGKSVFSNTVEEINCIPAPAEENLLVDKIVLSKAKYVIVGIEQYSGPLYSALPTGGVIARFGVGHDGIDKEKVKEHSLYCTNTPDVLTHSVAELTIALIMMSARHLDDMTESIKKGQWLPQKGAELYNKTLAIIGCGNIGRRVAQIAAFGLQMRVIGYDNRDLDADGLKREYGFTSIVGDFGKSVKVADFVTLHIPLEKSTEKFINSEKLHLMPKGAWLINTSRGPIVDEIALFNVLRSGEIAGAALDVFAREPYEPVNAKHDLRLLNNVIFTPHIGSLTFEANRRMAERCLQNVYLAEKGDYDKMDLVAGPE